MTKHPPHVDALLRNIPRARALSTIMTLVCLGYLLAQTSFDVIAIGGFTALFILVAIGTHRKTDVAANLASLPIGWFLTAMLYGTVLPVDLFVLNGVLVCRAIESIPLRHLRRHAESGAFDASEPRAERHIGTLYLFVLAEGILLNLAAILHRGPALKAYVLAHLDDVPMPVLAMSATLFLSLGVFAVVVNMQSDDA